MRLIAFGGDARMDGVLLAAKRAGWETAHIREEADVPQDMHAKAAVLPWPRSFEDGKLVGGALKKERVLALLPPDAVLLRGAGFEADELKQNMQAFDPAMDEAFQKTNAELTAEGAICRAMQRQGRALMGATCVVTGFGRIGQALAKRLAALSSFVIVCARSEKQMRMAHDIGAHPVPLASVSSALRHADVVFNTVPARIMGWEELRQMKKDALLIELASLPYGADPALAQQLGVQMAIESGLPGRYAAQEAGGALFAALVRAMERRNEQGGQEHG